MSVNAAIKTGLIMNILSWILGTCNTSVPTEQQYYGYNLPINNTTQIWTDYKPKTLQPQDGAIRFVARDNYFNKDLMDKDGIGALDTTTNQLLWQTPFPEKPMVSIYNKNDSSYFSSDNIILNNNHLLCVYKHTIPPQQGDYSTSNETFYKYIILDSKTGKILKKDAMKLPIKEIEFVFIGNHWFIKNHASKQISRLNPNTGVNIWTYNRVLQSFASLNEQTLSFFNDNLDDTWQIVVLNLATGQPIFEKKIENIPKHRITDVLCQDNKVFVAMGVTYEINPLGAIGKKYKDYTVAFDLKSTDPLWRTGFVKY